MSRWIPSRQTRGRTILESRRMCVGDHREAVSGKYSETNS